MAEGARLESVYAGNRIEGSNPSPSAIILAFDLIGSSMAAFFFAKQCFVIFLSLWMPLGYTCIDSLSGI